MKYIRNTSFTSLHCTEHPGGKPIDPHQMSGPASTLGPGYNEKKYMVVLSDFIYLVIVTEQITYIEDTCYQAFYLLIRYNQVRVPEYT